MRYLVYSVCGTSYSSSRGRKRARGYPQPHSFGATDVDIRAVMGPLLRMCSDYMLVSCYISVAPMLC